MKGGRGTTEHRAGAGRSEHTVNGGSPRFQNEPEVPSTPVRIGRKLGIVTIDNNHQAVLRECVRIWREKQKDYEAMGDEVGAADARAAALRFEAQLKTGAKD